MASLSPVRDGTPGPAPESSEPPVTAPTGGDAAHRRAAWSGWRGRIRTLYLLMQSRAAYRLALRQGDRNRVYRGGWNCSSSRYGLVELARRSANSISLPTGPV